MRDNLLDIVKNTYGLGIIDLVKINGTDTETAIEALAEDTFSSSVNDISKTRKESFSVFQIFNIT